MQVVADTSALVSLGTVADQTWSPIDYHLDTHTIIVPTLIFDELEETAAYDNASGYGAKQFSIDGKPLTNGLPTLTLHFFSIMGRTPR